MGGQELQQKKAEIQVLSDQTSTALKKHVYENYMQFIETSREISRNLIYFVGICFKRHFRLCYSFADLESEMYQLSHVLIEQRNLLSVLKENALPNNQKPEIEKTPDEEVEGKQ